MLSSFLLCMGRALPTSTKLPPSPTTAPCHACCYVASPLPMLPPCLHILPWHAHHCALGEDLEGAFGIWHGSGGWWGGGGLGGTCSLYLPWRTHIFVQPGGSQKRQKSDRLRTEEMGQEHRLLPHLLLSPFPTLLLSPASLLPVSVSAATCLPCLPIQPCMLQTCGLLHMSFRWKNIQIFDFAMPVPLPGHYYYTPFYLPAFLTFGVHSSLLEVFFSEPVPAYDVLSWVSLPGTCSAIVHSSATVLPVTCLPVCHFYLLYLPFSPIPQTFPTTTSLIPGLLPCPFLPPFSTCTPSHFYHYIYICMAVLLFLQISHAANSISAYLQKYFPMPLQWHGVFLWHAFPFFYNFPTLPTCKNCACMPAMPCKHDCGKTPHTLRHTHTHKHIPPTTTTTSLPFFYMHTPFSSCCFCSDWSLVNICSPGALGHLIWKGRDLEDSLSMSPLLNLKSLCPFAPCPVACGLACRQACLYLAFAFATGQTVVACRWPHATAHHT